jgi:hypothetical protein
MELLRRLEHMPPLTRLLARALLGGSCLLPAGIPKLLAQECRLPPPDTLRTVLLATIRTVPSGLSLESRQLALQELVGLLPPGSRLPLGVSLDVGDAFLDSTAARRMLVASSGIAFTVNPNGFIRDASLIEGARTPAGAPVDQLLQRLVRRADSARVLGGMLMGQEAGRADTVRVELRLTAFPEPDDVSQPVVRLAIAYARADRRAEPVPDNPAPRYPKEALDGRLGDTVRVSFVVGEDGRPEGGSVEILRASHKEFSDAVSYVLPYYRFHPARAGDCVVRSLRVMEFTFAGGKVVSEVALDPDPPTDRRPLLGVSGDEDDAVPDNSGGVLGKLQMPFAFRMRGHPDVPFGPVDGGFVPPMFPGSADAKPPGTP